MSDPVTVAQVAQNVNAQFASVQNLLSAGAYLAGCVFGIKAALGFKEHSEDPERVRLSLPVTSVVMAGFLLSVPTFLSVALDPLPRDPDAHVATLGAPASSPPAAIAPAAKVEPAIPVAAQAAPATPSPVAFHDSAPAQAPSASLVKEPAHGGSGDLQALLEIVALFASLGLAGFYFIAKAAKRGESRRQEIQAAMADLTMASSASSSSSGLAAKEPGVQE